MANIQLSIRVPQDVYDELKTRAGSEGLTANVWAARAIKNELDEEARKKAFAGIKASLGKEVRSGFKSAFQEEHDRLWKASFFASLNSQLLYKLLQKEYSQEEADQIWNGTRSKVAAKMVKQSEAELLQEIIAEAQ